MFTLGVTGGIGSGKSLVTDLLRRKGAFIIDADEIAREVVAPGMPALTAIHEHFGADTLLPDDSLNRKALRAKIFNAPDEKAWLESVLHPRIRARANELLQAPKDHPYQGYCVPLLLEKGLDQHVDKVLVVDVPPDIQLQRAAARDGASADDIRRIIDSQVSREQRLAKADYVIDNSGTIEQTVQQVDNLHQTFLTLSKSYER